MVVCRGLRSFSGNIINLFDSTDVGAQEMKLTKVFSKEEDRHIVTADDESMIAFMRKLGELSLSPSEHVKIYWRKYRKYRPVEIDVYYIYGIFPNLQHEVSLSKNDGRRMWLTHRFQRFIGEDTSSIEIRSEEQIRVFDLLFDAWMRRGKNVQDSDSAVAEEIMEL